MALVDLTSDLSRIDSVPAETATNLEKEPTPAPQKLRRVNYFTDYNARGFILNKDNSTQTDFRLSGAGHPRNQSVFYDSKGDFVPVFTERRKATASQESRLLLLHTQGIRPNSPLRQSDEGYTNYINPVPLNNYYDLINNDTGVLGIRNDDVDSRLTTKKQPIIIRDNNQRWGSIKNTPLDLPVLTTNFRLTAGLVDELAGSILGREPSIFVDRYLADIERINGVANPLFSIFAEKQRVLQRRNAFDKVTSVKYNPNLVESPFDLPAVVGQALPALSDASTLLLNPKIYNPGSVYGPLSFHRMGILDVTALRNQTGAVAIGIAGLISLRALQLSGQAAVKIIGTGISGLAAIGRGIGGLIANAPGIKGISTRKILGDKAVQNLHNFGQDAGTFFKDTAADISDGLEKAGTFIRDKGKIIAGVAGDLSDIAGTISKAKAVQLDPAAFGDVGVDKVNLIPYGKDEDKEGKKYYELDWIPFKFVDANNNKPIVFRAILSAITDTFTPEYASERYIGRPDNVYVYQGTTRELAFTFDVYPKSAEELPILWEKLNYLAGLTYPHMETGLMESPFCKLTIGQMYDDAPGYISGLTYTVMDETTWEVDFAKLPKYVQVSCTYVYVGDRLPTATQKHFDIPRIPEEQYQGGITPPGFDDILPDFVDPQDFEEINIALGGAGNDFMA